MDTDRRRWLVRAAAASAGALAGPLLPVPAQAAALRDSDRVFTFPTVARRLPDGSLAARIDAWVYEAESRPGALSALAAVLQLDLAALAPAARQRFESRGRLFKTDSHSGRQLLAWPDSSTPAMAQPLPGSDSFGRVSTRLRWAPGVVPAASAEPASAWACTLALAAEPAAAPARRFEQRSWVLPAQGLSVVSDIDDTIKHTQVRQWRQMLLNTFVNEFSAVPGMAAWYERLARAQAGTAFHYVSGGPQHLGPVMLPFLQEQGFPPGSLHLRAFSFKPHRLLEHSATRRHKLAAMTQLLDDHPERRLLLVGDSGELDPETYGELARRHGDRVAGIVIRDVTGESADAARYAQAFEGLPRSLWRLFTDPASLPVNWF